MGSLKAMGFLDEVMLEAVVAKHGDDIDACATDLAKASEWDGLLDDLIEMGFDDRERNKVLMLKNNGNIKRTVKDLVEGTAPLPDESFVAYVNAVKDQAAT